MNLLRVLSVCAVVFCGCGDDAPDPETERVLWNCSGYLQCDGQLEGVDTSDDCGTSGEIRDALRECAELLDTMCTSWTCDVDCEPTEIRCTP